MPRHSGGVRGSSPGFAPRQPVTITFRSRASPRRSSPAIRFRASMKPQVLTMTASAPAWLRASSYPRRAAASGSARCRRAPSDSRARRRKCAARAALDSGGVSYAGRLPRARGRRRNSRKRGEFPAIGRSSRPGQARKSPAVARSVLALIPDGVPLLLSRPGPNRDARAESSRPRAVRPRARSNSAGRGAARSVLALFFNGEFRHPLKLEFLGQTDRLVAIVAKDGHSAHAQTPLRFCWRMFPSRAGSDALNRNSHHREPP